MNSQPTPGLQLKPGNVVGNTVPTGGIRTCSYFAPGTDSHSEKSRSSAAGTTDAAAIGEGQLLHRSTAAPSHR